MSREYTDGEIRQYIREVVSEAKRSANVDTGFLKRSIKGALIGRNRSVEFREIFYGAYNENSKLLEIAQRIMPKDIDWKIIYEDEEGETTTIKGTTRTGRTIRRSTITSENVSTKNIKALISSIRGKRKKKNDTGEGNREDNEG
jgi:hypothetical protein